jgi:hypothetical protein
MKSSYLLGKTHIRHYDVISSFIENYDVDHFMLLEPKAEIKIQLACSKKGFCLQCNKPLPY